MNVLIKMLHTPLKEWWSRKDVEIVNLKILNHIFSLKSI